MEDNSIDASLGLALAIDLLQQSQQTGELRGDISIAHFLKTTRYRCIIYIEQGQVVSCSLLDERGLKRSIDKGFLIRADAKGGPFDWKFHVREAPSPSPPVPVQTSPLLLASMTPDVSTMKDDAVPVRLSSELHFTWLTTWNEQDIRFLHQIFSLINGERTVGNIKTLMFRSTPEAIERSLIFLIAMKQIEIRRIKGK